MHGVLDLLIAMASCCLQLSPGDTIAIIRDAVQNTLQTRQTDVSEAHQLLQLLLANALALAIH